MATLDARLGEFNTDGTVKTWPTQDINGGTADHSPNRHKLSNQYFVILPVGFNDWQKVADLKAMYAPAPEVAVEIVPDVAVEAEPEESSGRRKRGGGE